MKYVAYCEGIAAPNYVLIEEEIDIENACKRLQFPLFVKPAKAGDSLGVDEHSLVHNKKELTEKVAATLTEYPQLLAEEYIDGREFTVLIAANADGKTATTFKPVEYIFPEGFAFKTYALKTSELHPNANIPCNDPVIEKQLREAAEKIFRGFNGAGYARLDFRLNDRGQLYFLEINFTCSVFYGEGYEGSADHILKHDGTGQAAFLRLMISEGMARYERIQKKYIVKGNAIAGYGIYATRQMQPKELVFKGEGRQQRIITRRFVEENWPDKEKLIFPPVRIPVK
jgi:hypothetical protein